MRCQTQKRNGWGVTRCKHDAEEGSTTCWSCALKAQRKQKKAVQTALGRPGKNPGWRDPEYREWIRLEHDCLLSHTGLCRTLPGRIGVESAHVTCKGHAADRKNLVPLCPWHHDEQQGRNNAFERGNNLSLTAEAERLDAEYESLSVRDAAPWGSRGGMK